MTPASLYLIRQFSQVPTMFPGVIQASHFTNRMATWSTKLLDPGGPLDGAPDIVRTIAKGVADNSSPEDVQSFFQKIGDAAANKFGEFIGAGRWQMDVNKMLAGSDEIVTLPDGSMYTYKTLRDMAVAEGVPGGSMQANFFASNIKSRLTGFSGTAEAETYLAKTYSLLGEEARSLTGLVENYAKSLGERERLSMFSAFIASGYKPVEASEMVRRSLFDYQQTLSEFDYGLMTRIMLPYWSFHKNNSRLQLDSMLDPMTAYRAGIVRKGPQSALALLQESVNDFYIDDLGVQVNMLDEDRQIVYEEYKKAILTDLGQTRFTEEQKSVMRSILLGISAGYKDKGKEFGTGAALLKINYIKDVIGVSDAMQVNPYVQGYVKPYQQGRPVFFFPSDLKDPDTNFRKQVNAPAVFNYLALPESGQAAFASHILALGTASASLALAGTSDLTTSDALLKNIPEALETTLSPEFNPVANLALKTVGATTRSGQGSIRIYSHLHKLFQDVGWDVSFEVPEKVVAGKVVSPKRYYASAWAGALINLVPTLAQGSKELEVLEGEGVGVSGDPVFDLSLNTAKLFGLQIERGDPEAVMRQVQPSDTIRTYRPQN